MHCPILKSACVAAVAIAAVLKAVSVSGQATSAPGPPPPAAQTRAGPVRQLSVDDAVRLALEQNLNIQVERLNPQIQDLSIAQARSFWSPSINSSIATASQDSPANSFLSGGQTKVSDDRFSTSVGVSQLLPWGGSYTASWDSSRATTTNLFTNFDPVLRTNVSATFVQPLLRNFKIDSARQQLLVSRKNRETSDVELRQTILTTIRNVKNAYWDLSYAITSLAVQKQALDLARELLRNNRTRVEVGTMAPIDIVEAEAEVALREEAVIVAEAAITQAEDRLRSLILDPNTPDFWNLRLEPTDTAPFQIQPIDLDAAVRNALDNRTDIQQAKKTLESSDINIRFFRNQTLPDVNLQADYGLAGLGGTQLIRGSGFPGPITGRSQRGFGSVLKDVFGNDFPSWNLSVKIGYPIGTSTAEANLARARLQYTQAQTQIRNLELQAATQVRETGRQVMTNLKRVDATRASRQLSERRLDAEQKKFAAGMSTSFFVFQAQRDLSLARNNELRAVLDYNKSFVDFEAVQEAPLNGGGVTLASGVVGAAGASVAGAGANTAGQAPAQLGAR